VPDQPHKRWTMDFTSDTLGDGRTLRTFNVVDDCTRLCVAIEVDVSLPGERVGRALDRAAASYGWPTTIVCDNGPEFTGKALDQWAYQRGITLSFIDPGKPVQNAFVESFNGKFREECLSENWFTSLAHARQTTERWRRDYNNVRPHRSLGHMSPAEYAASLSPERPSLHQESPLGETQTLTSTEP